MRVIYGLTHFKPQNIKPAVALGVFDGLHRGHQKIIANLLKQAKAFQVPSLIVTFFPHPQKKASLYSLPHRLQLLEEAGVDLCLVIHFSTAFRRIPAKKFLENILIKKINPEVVLIGRNFNFGRYAEGNWQMLRDYSKKAGFKLRVINVLTYKGNPISSNYIRVLIKGGDFRKAQDLLGRPVTIFGRVTGGNRFARILGYPTANIEPDHEILPPFGVYAVRVMVAYSPFNGICYIGNRPTINQIRRKSIAASGFSSQVKATNKTNIEVHIFDFTNNLYGRRIQIEFIRKIRAEKRFGSSQALARQIKRDILNCHKIFHL